MSKIIKRENIFKYFFFCFLLSVPLQTRKVFFTDYSFYTGEFTEYGSIFLYLSDLLFFAALISLVLFNSDIIKKGLSELKNKSGKSRNGMIFRAILILVTWFFVDTLISGKYIEIGLFRSFKMVEMLLLVFFIFSTLKEKSFLLSSLFAIVISGFLQSILAIYQFLYQKNLFSSPLLHKLTGETVLSPFLPGIAKIGEGGEKMIRSYGTFPHPNLLGGFLIFSLFISFYLYLEHKYYLLSRVTPFFKNNRKLLNRYLLPVLWITIFTIQLLALTLSFSRSAWLGFAISSVIFLALIFRCIKIVSRETIIAGFIKKYKEIILTVLLLTGVFIGNLNLLSSRIFQDVSREDGINSQSAILPQNDTFTDRYFFNIVSRETIARSPILGSGPGTSVFQIKPYLDRNGKTDRLESWQYQPPHNIYILSTAEIGIIGFCVLLLIVVGSIRRAAKDIVSRETFLDKKIFKICILSTLCGFLFVGFFDHYFWTLQQGQLIFWMTIGLLLI